MQGYYILYSLGFLFLNVVILLLVLRSSKKKPAPAVARAKPVFGSNARIPPEDILQWEYEYARITASEAMEDRHKIVNFYLLVAGIVASGVINISGKDHDPGDLQNVAPPLLWIFCILGWFYFLSIVRLRDAWYESVQAMLAIKEYCVENADQTDPLDLWKAFRWRHDTLPLPEKAWTLYHFSALLIGFLNSVAFVIGAFLLDYEEGAPPDGGIFMLSGLGLVFFIFHAWLYYEFLHRERNP